MKGKIGWYESTKMSMKAILALVLSYLQALGKKHFLKKLLQKSSVLLGKRMDLENGSWARVGGSNPTYGK